MIADSLEMNELFQSCEQHLLRLNEVSRFTENFPEIFKYGKGLAFYAHQDDEALSSSAFLINFSHQISRIIYTTDGATRGDASLAQIRKKEALGALSICGIAEDKVEIWDCCTFGDRLIFQERVDRTIQAIEENKPDFILLHDYEGGHPDHDWTFAAVSLACHKLRLTNLSFCSFACYNIQEINLFPTDRVDHLNLDDIAKHNCLIPRNIFKEGKSLTYTLSKKEFIKKIEMLKVFQSQLKDVSYFAPWTQESYYIDNQIPHPVSLCERPQDSMLFYEFVGACSFEQFKKEITYNITRLKL